MPVISRFYGMIVKMYFQQREHNPPHIHVLYGEYIGVIDIKSHEMIEGDLPEKGLVLVKDWLNIHGDELLQIWDTQEFRQLSPL